MNGAPRRHSLVIIALIAGGKRHSKVTIGT
jgi:hypothetical protein